MKPTDETLVRFLRATQGAALSEQSLRRVASASGTVADAVRAAAGESLFDTEPAMLHRVLDELAGDDG